MSNRKTIKCENELGKFTTVNYKVLRDKKLSPISRILLIEILSDSDNFTLSPTMYSNRLGVTKKTLYKSIQQLVDNGYIRRTNISKPGTKGKEKLVYHYLISEYGNLKQTKEITKEPIVEVKVISNDTIIPEVKEEPLKGVKTISNEELELERAVRTEIKRIVDDVISITPFTDGNKEIRSGKVKQLYIIGLNTYNNTGEFPTKKEISNKRLSLQSTITALKTGNQDQKYQN